MRETFSFLTMVKLGLTVAVVAAVSCCSSALGQFGDGPALMDPEDIAVEASGDLVVLDPSLDAVFRVDPVTGDCTFLSPPTVPPLGDANGDGRFDTLDIAPFVLALIMPASYQAMFPKADPDVVLDMNFDGGFDNLDIVVFVAALTGL